MSTSTPFPRDPAADPLTRHEKLSVAEAKQRLADVIHSIDPLRPVKEHPYVVIGAAATIGVVLGSSGKAVSGLGSFTASLTRLLKPLSGIVAQVVAAKVAAETVKPDDDQPSHSDAATVPDAYEQSTPT